MCYLSFRVNFIFWTEKKMLPFDLIVLNFSKLKTSPSSNLNYNVSLWVNFMLKMVTEMLNSELRFQNFFNSEGHISLRLPLQRKRILKQVQTWKKKNSCTKITSFWVFLQFLQLYKSKEKTKESILYFRFCLKMVHRIAQFWVAFSKFLQFCWGTSPSYSPYNNNEY